MRGAIWLGDVLEACTRLGISDPNGIRRVADLLMPDRPRALETEMAAPVSHSVPSGANVGISGKSVQASLSAAASETGKVLLERPTHLVEVTTPTPTADGPTSTALVLEQTDSWQLEPEPLFAPTVDRAIVRELSLLQVVSNRIDIERVIQLSAQARPLARLPYRSSLTTRLGVDLLLDTSTSMMAVQQDVAAFPAALERVLGRTSVRVLRFESVPLRAGIGPRRKWHDYTPDGQKRVIVVTRLDTSELVEPWLEAIRRIERTAARALALVPHGVDDVPSVLRRGLDIVSWDRGTTAAAVRKIVRGFTA